MKKNIVIGVLSVVVLAMIFQGVNQRTTISTAQEKLIKCMESAQQLQIEAEVAQQNSLVNMERARMAEAEAYKHLELARQQAKLAEQQLKRAIK